MKISLLFGGSRPCDSLYWYQLQYLTCIFLQVSYGLSVCSLEASSELYVQYTLPCLDESVFRKNNGWGQSVYKNNQGGWGCMKACGAPVSVGSSANLEAPKSASSQQKWGPVLSVSTSTWCLICLLSFPVIRLICLKSVVPDRSCSHQSDSWNWVAAINQAHMYLPHTSQPTVLHIALISS